MLNEVGLDYLRAWANTATELVIGRRGAQRYQLASELQRATRAAMRCAGRADHRPASGRCRPPDGLTEPSGRRAGNTVIVVRAHDARRYALAAIESMSVSAGDLGDSLQ
jgi:excinuclease UvrABC ATPase subunit